MGTHVATLVASWSQTASNRTRDEAVTEIADYTGGGNRPVIQARALAAWNAAVREYNTISWKFNRTIDDITLVDDTQDYGLNSNFHLPMRAVLLDSNGKEVQPVCWVSFEEWLHFDADNTGVGEAPDEYTCRNVHDNGLVTVFPRVSAPIRYPTLRIHYLRRIALATEASAKLAVPMEVDEGIFQLAVAKHVAKEKGARQAIELYTLAGSTRARLEQQWRDWPDF